MILKKQAGVFSGRKIVRVEGTAPIDKERLISQRVVGLRGFGKHLLVEFWTFALRVHLLMLGSYCIDQRKDKPIRLGLGSDEGSEINFYSCSLNYIDEPLDEVYDWRIDVLADQWGERLARKNLRGLAEVLVCDALLDLPAVRHPVDQGAARRARPAQFLLRELSAAI